MCYNILELAKKKIYEFDHYNNGNEPQDIFVSIGVLNHRFQNCCVEYWCSSIFMSKYEGPGLVYRFKWY